MGVPTDYLVAPLGCDNFIFFIGKMISVSLSTCRYVTIISLIVVSITLLFETKYMKAVVKTTELTFR